MFIHIVPHILAWWPEPCLVHFGPIFGGVVPWSENGHRHVDHRDTTYHHIFSPKNCLVADIVSSIHYYMLFYLRFYPLNSIIFYVFRFILYILFNVWHCIWYIHVSIYMRTYIYTYIYNILESPWTSSCCGGCSFYLGKLTQIWITLKNPLFPGESKLYKWMKKTNIYYMYYIYIYWLMVRNIFSIYWE
jgi:hypothetical protein